MTKKQIKKFTIIPARTKQVKSIDEICDTILIVAKKNKAVYCLEKTWIKHELYYRLVNMYTYKAQYETKAGFKEYLQQLLDLDFDLTVYQDWDDLLKDLGITIPSKYNDN